MEPTQAEPIKKRRRWLLAAFALALVSATSWWYWPRGDVRFVGKWNMHTSDGDVLQVLTFSESGRIDCFVPHRGELEPTRSYWIKGDQLIFGPSVADALLGPQLIGDSGRLKRVLSVLLGQSQAIAHRFTTVADDEIRLEAPGFDGPFVTTLRRVPE